MRRTARVSIRLALAIAIIPATAFAAPPPDLRDLVGARAGQAENAIRARGYIDVDREQRPGRSIVFWWNQQRGNCVAIETTNGRYQSIDVTPPARCRQGGPGGPGFPGGPGGPGFPGGPGGPGGPGFGQPQFGSTPPGVRDLVGIGSIAGENALRNRGFRFSQAASGGGPRNAFWWAPDQRYCLSVISANNRFQALSVTTDQACRTGVIGSPPRPGPGGRPIVDFSYFPGMRIPDADARLGNAGFTVVDRFRSGNSFYVIWYNRGARQCLQMTNANSRVVDVRDIRTHPRCR